MLDALPDLRARVLADAAAVLPPGSRHAGLDATARSGWPALRCASGCVPTLATIIATITTITTTHASDRQLPRHGRRASRPRRSVRGTAAHAIAILRHPRRGRSRDPPRAGRRRAFPRDRRLGFADGRGRRPAASPRRSTGARWTRLRRCRAAAASCARSTGCCRCRRRRRRALLEGFAWRDDGIGGERVTPTGAAILRHLVEAAAARASPAGCSGTGTGAGTRDAAGHAQHPARARVRARRGGTAERRRHSSCSASRSTT